MSNKEFPFITLYPKAFDNLINFNTESLYVVKRCIVYYLVSMIIVGWFPERMQHPITSHMVRDSHYGHHSLFILQLVIFDEGKLRC